MARDDFGNYVVGVTPDPYTPGSSSGGALHGSGPPDNSLGQDGKLYVDEDTGDVYVKFNGSWTLVQGTPGGSGESGIGSPEGVITAGVGTTYVDLSNNGFWVKTSGSGNTGWTALIV